MKYHQIIKALSRIALAYLVLLTLVVKAQAPGDSVLLQQTSQQYAVPVPNKINPVAPVPLPTAQVLAVRVIKVDESSKSLLMRSNTAYPDDIIEIKISNPQQFLLLRPTDQSKLVLYADGLQLNGISSHRFELLSRQDVASGQIALPDTMWIPFELKRDSSTQHAWETLYRIADHWYDNRIDFQANLGWEGMFPLSMVKDKDLNSKIALVFFDMSVFWIWLIFYAGLIALFVYLCANTNLIRTNSPGNNGAYSLSQTQLVFWTVLVIGGFIYSVMLTDLTTALNPSVLLLLGISIGTTGVANSINYYNKKKPSSPGKVHKNFLYDILSDGDSISVHRTQILLWNIVFGIYFVIFTVNNKTMPVFSNTLLVLSGVSSTFYLGSKVTENADGNISVTGTDQPAGAPPDPNAQTPYNPQDMSINASANGSPANTTVSSSFNNPPQPIYAPPVTNFDPSVNAPVLDPGLANPAVSQVDPSMAAVQPDPSLANQAVSQVNTSINQSPAS